MSDGIRLDHIGIAVHSLAAARTDYERLGFATTLLGLHESPPRPGEPPALTGSGNHCIMLRDGYLELIGVTDASKPSSLRMLLERYEGAHILALGAGNAAAARQAILARGFAIGQPALLEREAPWGEEGRETRRAAFANAYLDRDAFPEARVFVIEHKTPEVIWQRHQLAHPNGAVGVVEAWLCGWDPEAVADRYARLAGTPPVAEAAGECVVALGRGRLRIMSRDAFAHRTGGLRPPAVPGMAGLTVAVRDLAQAEKLLRDNGLPMRKDTGGLLITGACTHGAAIFFIEDR